MSTRYQNFLSEKLDGLKTEGLFKSERVITTPQSSAIKVEISL